MTEPADFEAYVRARSPALLRSAFLLTGDEHLAEDLVQDALWRTHRAWTRVCHTSPDAYTRKVMYHLNISWWRQRRGVEVSTAMPPERPDRQVELDTSVALQRALMQLTPKQRAVIVLRFYEDLTESATAEVLGVTVGTVKSQCAKALSRLRAHAVDLQETPR
jgi:RNA polymerase sigma-70 factor (sigma-E family)